MLLKRAAYAARFILVKLYFYQRSFVVNNDGSLQLKGNFDEIYYCIADRLFYFYGT